MKNQEIRIDSDYQIRLAEADRKRDEEAKQKLALLDKEAKLLPLKRELLAHIESFIQWIDLSNEWFLKSRDLRLTDEERKLNLVIYEFYKKRSDLILKELSDFLPKEFQNG